jgi:hypothetical protein
MYSLFLLAIYSFANADDLDLDARVSKRQHLSQDAWLGLTMQVNKLVQPTDNFLANLIIHFTAQTSYSL